MAWRWDQGRLDYFQMDSIRAIARTLASLDSIDLRMDGIDPLSAPLMKATGLPFDPQTPTRRIWRNYGRVFACQLLATQVDGRLTCTDLCHELANPDTTWGPDEYLVHVATHFYLPSPAFQDYQLTERRVFPFCALVKLLAARALMGTPEVKVRDVFSLLVGNGVTGVEPLDTYRSLQPTGYAPQGEEGRQVREMMAFFSQLSILKWQRPSLFLDLSVVEEGSLRALANTFTPVLRPQNQSRAAETLQLGAIQGKPKRVPELERAAVLSADDQRFVEGGKVQVTHLRTERSRKLRELYFLHVDPPYKCDICRVNAKRRYPWTENLLEVHHVLPLASPVRVEKGGTSLKDVVGLCPTCHRATHSYYRSWLREKAAKDFRSDIEARNVYQQAKQRTVLH